MAQGDEHGAVQNTAALPDLFVARIQQDKGVKPQGPGAPGFQFHIELRAQWLT